MGREVRMVPGNWEHPKVESGHRSALGYRPLFRSADVAALRAEWDEAESQWERGLVTDYNGGWEPKCDAALKCRTYSDWSGNRPDPSDYMPNWPADQRTHLQMYETCTEGTPISPVMPDAESLARWLADNRASAFGGMTATYEQWLATCRAGWAPSAVFDGALRSGVEAVRHG